MRSLVLVAAILTTLLPCSSELLVSVARASDFSGSPAGVGPNFQGATRDVAVISITQVGPPFVNEGNTITINIGVSNNGSSEETFALELLDNTADELIASRQATLAAESTTTISVDWITEGATGGPAPPGPPTPGTIHALTATVTLAGDTVGSNNSMSLLPGIWVIAAPDLAGITFPEKSKEPLARITSGLATEEPASYTEAEPLVDTYVGPVFDQLQVALSGPTISTTPTSPIHVFSSAVEAGEGLTSSKPEITTLANPLSEVTTGEIGAKQEQLLTVPGIVTSATPLNGVFLYQNKPSSVASLSSPAVTTPGEDLGQIFAAPSVSKEVIGLAEPDIGADAAEEARIAADAGQTDLEASLAKPGVTTRKSPLATVYDSVQGANAEGVLGMSGFRTGAIPNDGIFLSPVEASMFRDGTKPEFAIQSVSGNQTQLDDEVGIGVTEPPVVALVETGTIRGRVRLQGRTNSLGSYIEIDRQVTFVDRQGYFLIQRRAGSIDLIIRAPGYLSMAVRNIELEPGDLLVLRTVTLPFGDADGDGVIDIYDLTVAAGNYGRTLSRVSHP